MNPQTAGLDDITGTYLFDLKTSHRAFKLNRFLWNMKNGETRDRFAADPEAVMTEAGLTEKEKAMVRAQDWIGLVRHGASFFVLEKLARVYKWTNLEVYASMRGETFDEFMKTRRVPECR